MDATRIKKEVGFAAADEYVKSGMRLGLGTGTTAIWCARRVGELMKQGKITNILAVPTSSQTELECQQLGIPLRSLNDPEINGELDLTIDGADEVDRDLCLTKGGGGALLIEKIVAYASKQFIVVIDTTKLVSHLGITFPIPIEVLRLARVPVARACEALGAKPEVRMAVKKMGPVITDNGNLLLDLSFSTPFDPKRMEQELSLIPGVLGNGIFSRVRPTVMVGHPDRRIETLR
ncbi:MAG: ribose-5-phosphate isomerase RpiA [Spirochaetes bacterium]|nr:ribose-5-phosphate isomerase RpiA [Spirochaetota bacterium]